MDNYGGQNGQQYGQPYGQPNGEQLEKPLTLGEWIITVIVVSIPCVGLIMLFVWGFGQGNTSRKNYCRAMLIMVAIGIVLSLIFYGIIGATLFSSLNSLSNY